MLLGMARGLLMLVPLALLSWPLATAARGEPLEDTLARVFPLAARQLEATASTLPETEYPSETLPDGTWDTTDADSFTSGFLPGSFWALYEYTGAPIWRTRAERWQAGLESQKDRTDDQDLGFILFTSFGNAYRLTGQESYRRILLTAASSLSQRYDARMGLIRSRGDLDDEDEFEVIIDSMMNIELLFWAARNGGRRELYDMAHQHALSVLESHVRADGSTYQTVNFDPRTRMLREQGKEQGCRWNTTWSRGQAWAVYGFTVAYRETKDPRMLRAARLTADYFIRHLPSDEVPYWDFQAPNIPKEPRDSSAAAATASALVELSQLETRPERALRYREAARDILRSLASPAYLDSNRRTSAILLHGTAFRPHDRFDTGLIYGDYFFLEALLRYSKLPERLTSREPQQREALLSAAPSTGEAPRNRERLFRFEEGILTPEATGVDRIVGPVTLVSEGALVGNGSVRIPDTFPAFLEEHFTDTTDFSTSFYLRVESLPSENTDLVSFLKGRTPLGNLFLRRNGTLFARNGPFEVGPRSNPMEEGELYRISLSQKRESGSFAILEASLARGDEAFECPFASSRVRLSTPRADRLRLGATTGPLDLVIDDVRLDTALP
ncbi:Glucuronyl hydrolase [Archangium gephyra]|uniref:Glucuronyl hydrolase n=1 Tax=Archangium gephyra TaxID=48 RepID=A0AAC8TEQ9_9BACT|nr:Glucuronyl hydrolase [Archangium gephyra]